MLSEPEIITKLDWMLNTFIINFYGSRTEVWLITVPHPPAISQHGM
jgi:hypothetical protein